MKARVLMNLSAAFLAALGVTGTFLPQEVLAHVGARPEATVVLLVQLLGALYLGLAALNWMNRGNRVGGIYSRPVAVANLIHFAVGAVTLLKGSVGAQSTHEVTVIAALYVVFGLWFGVVLFWNPQDRSST